MREIFVGDIHGCLGEFEALLEKLAFDPNMDELFLVGDLINKGPDSLGVYSLARKLGARVVLGNHELGLLQYVQEGLNANPRFEALKVEFGGRFQELLEWIESLELVIEKEHFLLVHGGLAPGRDWRNTPKGILCNIRTWDGKAKDLKNEANPAWYEFYKQEKLVIFGHWAKRGLVQGPNYIGLDSGCVYGKKLSALVLPEKKIVQVKAQKTYCPIRGA